MTCGRQTGLQVSTIGATGIDIEGETKTPGQCGVVGEVLAQRGHVHLVLIELDQAGRSKGGKGDGRCVVNLSEVTYIDSSGLATLVEGLQLAQKGGGVFALCAIEHPMIKDLLELTHLTEAFTIFESEADAVAQ